MTPEEFSVEYDRLFAAGQKIFEDTNACDIRGGKCAREHAGGSSSFCCHGCEHLSDDGCTVKALWCKLWTCAAARDNLGDEGLQRLHQVKFEARRFSTYGRRSKEQTMEEFERCGLIQKG